MSRDETLAKLKEGLDAWNTWREENNKVEIDLRNEDLQDLNLAGYNLSKGNFGRANFTGAILIGADLTECLLDNANLSFADLRLADLQNAIIDDAYLTGCNLEKANLNQAHICGTCLSDANLTEATLCYAEICGSEFLGSDLSRADLHEANLIDTNLSFANLTQANLSEVNLSGASLKEANLTNADLTRAILVETDISGAHFEGTKVYGISSWDLITKNTVQRNLIITKDGQPVITVDDLEVAQFIYLLLNNQKIRNVIETVTSKAVLILGRFTDERKGVLDALLDELRNQNYLPILFDFEKPATRDLTETISILAKLSRFVIVDLTDPNSVPHELATLIPNSRSLPFASIMLKGQKPYPLFRDFSRYDWVLPTFEYESEAHLIDHMAGAVIEPAERKVQEIRSKG